jgi:hypothetical protein
MRISAALPYVPPTPESVVAERMGVRDAEPPPRIAQLKRKTVEERPPTEPQFWNMKHMHPAPMRSIGSQMVRPMQPLWQSIDAIEAMLRPLNRTGRPSVRARKKLGAK